MLLVRLLFLEAQKTSQQHNQLISVPADSENVHILHLGTNYLFLELPVIFFCMPGIDLNGTKGLLCVELIHVAHRLADDVQGYSAIAYVS